MRCWLLALCLVALARAEAPVPSLPGVSTLHPLRLFTGYLPTGDEHDSKLFYFYVESDTARSEDPLVLWLNGGPGCASLTGFFQELGPLKLLPIAERNSSAYPVMGCLENIGVCVSWNPNSWHYAHANVLFVDQPIGVGLSFASTPAAYPTNLRDTSKGLYNALFHFVTVVHPEFSGRPFFITGESYAGKWLPALAEYWLEQSDKAPKTEEPFPLNLAGMAIGDGLMDPFTQRFLIRDAALGMGLISAFQYSQLETLNRKCYKEMVHEDWVNSANTCKKLFTFLEAATGEINMYDGRMFGPPYNKSAQLSYLNNPDFRAALGITDLQPIDNTCNETVRDSMAAEVNPSMVPTIVKLLERDPPLRTLIFVGNFDLRDGPPGIEKFLHDMKWSRHSEFANAERQVWKISDPTAEGGTRPVGWVKAAGPLTYLVVHGAGHYLPMDQGVPALDMIKTFMADRSFLSPSQSVTAQLCALLYDCNKHGKCDTARGGCVCEEGWTGLDCGSPVVEVDVAALLRQAQSEDEDARTLQPSISLPAIKGAVGTAEWVYYRLAVPRQPSRLSASRVLQLRFQQTERSSSAAASAEATWPGLVVHALGSEGQLPQPFLGHTTHTDKGPGRERLVQLPLLPVSESGDAAMDVPVFLVGATNEGRDTAAFLLTVSLVAPGSTGGGGSSGPDSLPPWGIAVIAGLCTALAMAAGVIWWQGKRLRSGYLLHQEPMVSSGSNGRRAASSSRRSKSGDLPRDLGNVQEEDGGEHYT